MCRTERQCAIRRKKNCARHVTDMRDMGESRNILALFLFNPFYLWYTESSGVKSYDLVIYLSIAGVYCRFNRLI